MHRGRSRQTVAHIPTDPGVSAVDPKLARVVEQGEKANIRTWVMVEMGHEMGYSPKDVMEALSNDSRAKMCLPPKPVGEGPAIQVFKGAVKEVDHGGVDAGDETSAAARSIPLQLGASPLDQFNTWKKRRIGATRGRCVSRGGRRCHGGEARGNDGSSAGQG